MRDYLLFTSAGDKFNKFNKEPYSWNSTDNANFDTFVVFYGDNKELSKSIKSEATYFLENKAAKFQNLVYAYQKHPDVFSKYKYVFVIDNDIEVSTVEINFLFNFANYLNYDIIQPSLRNIQRCRKDHWLMIQTPGVFFSDVNFIEVNLPLFNNQYLIQFVEYLINLKEPLLSGYGMDHVYLDFFKYKLKDNSKKFGIVHGIGVVNPLEENREIDNYESLEQRKKHFKFFIDKHKIVQEKNVEYKMHYECPAEMLDEYKLVLDYIENNNKD